MLHLIDTEIPVKGLERPLTILQVTDLHLIRADDRESERVRELRKKQLNWFPHSDEVWESIQEYCRITPPDAVVFTGDVSGFPTQSNLEALQDFLKGACPPYLYVFGNHERMFFLEDLCEETCRHYTKAYAFACKEEPDLQVMELGGVLLIGIDDSDNQITASQLERLKELFKRGLPCLLFMHVPLYIDTLLDDVMRVWGQPLMLGTPPEAVPQMDSTLIPSQTTTAFRDLLIGQSTPVQGVFAGHVHFSHEDVLFGNRKQYVTGMAAAPEDQQGTARLIRLIPA